MDEKQELEMLLAGIHEEFIKLCAFHQLQKEQDERMRSYLKGILKRASEEYELYKRHMAYERALDYVSK